MNQNALISVSMPIASVLPVLAAGGYNDSATPPPEEFNQMPTDTGCGPEFPRNSKLQPIAWFDSALFTIEVRQRTETVSAPDQERTELC